MSCATNLIDKNTKIQTKELIKVIQEIRIAITDSMKNIINDCDSSWTVQREIKKLIDKLSVLNDIEYFFKIKNNEFKKLHQKSIEYLKDISNYENNRELFHAIEANIYLISMLWSITLKMMKYVAYLIYYPERLEKNNLFYDVYADDIFPSIEALKADKDTIIEISYYYYENNSVEIDNNDYTLTSQLENTLLEELENAKFTLFDITKEISKEKNKTSLFGFLYNYFDC